MEEDILKPDPPPIEFYRRDSYAKIITVTDFVTKAAIDFTGYTVELAVNSLSEPKDTSTEKFSVAGVIVDATGGVISFAPSQANNDLPAGDYYYDIVMVAGTERRTIVKGVYVILGGINQG